MKTVSTDFKFLVENSANPMMIFDIDGKVLYSNTSAELLTGIHLSLELFRLAVNYAPKSFGSRTSYLELTYGCDSFYAITVLYENEDEICLYLYRKFRTLIPKNLSLDGYNQTDINMLLEANIELFKMNYSKKITLFTDYSLPKFQMQQNSFSILLRKIFERCYHATIVDITLKIKIGETLIIDHKKYPIVIFMLKVDKRDCSTDEEIEHLAFENHIGTYLQESSIVLEIPCIN